MREIFQVGKGYRILVNSPIGIGCLARGDIITITRITGLECGGFSFIIKKGKHSSETEHTYGWHSDFLCNFELVETKPIKMKRFVL